MSQSTESVKYTNNVLYRVPIIYEFSGGTDVQYVDPALVNNLRKTTIQVADPNVNSNERHDLEVTMFYSGEKYYFTTLTIKELAALLDLGLVEPAAVGA